MSFLSIITKTKQINLRVVIDNCIRLIQSKADSGHLTIRVETSPNMPRLRADERKIKQILTNLLSNAVKFTPAHGKITVTARIEFDGHLSISVPEVFVAAERSGVGASFASA